MAVPHAASLRRLVTTALLAYLAFVIYGSLVPLRLQPLPLDEALARFASTPMLNLGLASRADLVANLLLFMPLAFLLRERLVGARRGALAMLGSLLIWLGCAALAVGIEFTQVFFPARTVSLNDITAEAAGAAGGLMVHALYGTRLRHWALGWWQAEGARPLAGRILRGYLVLLVLFAVMPLDLTVSPVELYHKYQEGRIDLLPFTDLAADPAQALYDMAVDVLLWAPVGLLWRLAGRSTGQAVLRGVMVAMVLELLQLFVFSRVTSTTDVITGGLGCGLGAMLAARPGAGAVSRRAWPLWLLLWVAGALAVFWYPFDFGLAGTSLAARWNEALRVPFATYYAGSEFQALNELLRKSLVFLPGGLLWAGWAAQQAGASPARRQAWHRIGALLAVLLALVVEGGQLALPGKVADFTDALLEAAGAWVGIFLGARLGAAAAVLPSARPAAAVFPPATPTASMAAPAVPGRAPAGLWLDAAITVGLALLLWRSARLPGVPYNVVELLPGSIDGLFTALGVAVALALLLAAPLWLHDRLLGLRRRSGWLLAAVVAGGLLAGLLLVTVTPEESLWDVVGAPVLGWPGELEAWGRYAALHAAATLAALGAVWGVRWLGTAQSHGMLTRWLLLTLACALPLHAVVVHWAATDNLTELMRDGGGPLASGLLFIGLAGLFAAASAVAAVLAGACRRGLLLGLAALAWPLATLALWQGTEPMLLKYGRAFSAAQFLLSSDREHYAGGAALLQRWVAACGALFLLTALLQWPGWRRVVALRAPAAARPARPSTRRVRTA
ncbi:VanZ family protein [Aquincola sp. J276]|uniref:VanZ family protein n=1 Tax=Aquincola sp. J276 TaxID=2898432 RepID=UPI0021518667|nr:VanZ family protein [Aquincola sp. J276]MCR5866242.1 VanZ family protein [Aquincola sp. J276]